MKKLGLAIDWDADTVLWGCAAYDSVSILDTLPRGLGEYHHIEDKYGHRWDKYGNYLLIGDKCGHIMDKNGHIDNKYGHIRKQR